MRAHTSAFPPAWEPGAVSPCERNARPGTKSKGSTKARSWSAVASGRLMKFSSSVAARSASQAG